MLTTLWCRIVIAWQLLRLVPRLDLNFFLSHQIIERQKEYEIFDKPDPDAPGWREWSRVELPFTAGDWLLEEDWPALLRGPMSRIVRSLARLEPVEIRDDHSKRDDSSREREQFNHTITDDGDYLINRRPSSVVLRTRTVTPTPDDTSY